MSRKDCHKPAISLKTEKRRIQNQQYMHVPGAASGRRDTPEKSLIHN